MFLNRFYKDKQLNDIRISFEQDKVFVRINNNIDDKIYYVRYFRIKDDFLHYETLITSGMYCSIGNNPSDGKLLITIISIDGNEIYYVEYDTELKSCKLLNSFENTHSISYLNKNDNLYKLKDPVIITGSPGGGTTIFFKFLRMCGLYVGNDCGSYLTRKPQESILFTSVIDMIKVRCIGNKDLASASYDLSPGILNDEYIKEMTERVNNNFDSYLNFSKKALKIGMNYFWGDADTNLTWGWKKPFNSLYMPILDELYDSPKILSVQKPYPPLTKSISPDGQSGSWFRNYSSEYSRDVFMNPKSKHKITKVDFNRFFSDIDYVNDILVFINLDPISNNVYNDILTFLNFNKREVK